MVQLVTANILLMKGTGPIQNLEFLSTFITFTAVVTNATQPTKFFSFQRIVNNQYIVCFVGSPLHQHLLTTSNNGSSQMEIFFRILLDITL